MSTAPAREGCMTIYKAFGRARGLQHGLYRPHSTRRCCSGRPRAARHKQTPFITHVAT